MYCIKRSFRQDYKSIIRRRLSEHFSKIHRVKYSKVIQVPTVAPSLAGTRSPSQPKICEALSVSRSQKTAHLFFPTSVHPVLSISVGNLSGRLSLSFVLFHISLVLLLVRLLPQRCCLTRRLPILLPVCPSAFLLQIASRFVGVGYDSSP